jgi:transcriptional regulator with XRE-family HTH domain
MATLEEKARFIAARLRAARELAGLSQGQSAKLLGLQRPSLTEAEAGNRKVSAVELSELARIYDVSIGWLAGADDEGGDDVDSAKIRLAARELTKLRYDDRDRIMQLIKSLGGWKR